MELSQIKYFITAAQTQNLSKAAQILNVTQSALSKSIGNLEDELGVLLFDRSGKKIILNDSGKKFLEHAMNSVRELDVAVSAAQSRDAPPVLYLGLFHHSEKFMQCLKAFSETNPDIVIHSDYLEFSSFTAAASEYDMLIFPQNPLFRKYKADPVYTDSYFLAVNKSDPLAGKDVVQINDLSGQKLIFIKLGNNLFDLPYHLCANLGTSGSIFTNSYEIQRWLVSNNHGVGFVPQGGAEPYAVDPDIALLPISEDGLNQKIMIGFKREKYISDVGKRFAEFVHGYFDTH